MVKVICLATLLFVMSTAMFATPAVPEIDATSSSSAVALLLGGLVVVRARYKK